MRKGFTTGSCAAAAAKAAAWMLLGGGRKEQIEIVTPAGILYRTKVEDISAGADSVCCAVRKDSGDDPDHTDGMLIYAKVSFTAGGPGPFSCSGQNPAHSAHRGDGREEKEASASCKEDEKSRVRIRGGRGIGRVTRPGLDQEVGCDAINSVPRAMIEKEVGQVMDLFDYRSALTVEISAPEGEKLAPRTFNPELGIEGGISILGTTGIVEPMSTKAVLDTIRVELSQKKAMGARVLVAVPGNYGLRFLKEQYGLGPERAVRCSNFIGDTVSMAAEAGFSGLVLCGHAGKLIKLSGGIMNTHSKEGDCRMELLAAAAIRCHASVSVLERILEAVCVEEACEILMNEGIGRQCFGAAMDRIHYYLKKRAGERMQTECVMYSNQFGILAATDGAEAVLKEEMT